MSKAIHKTKNGIQYVYESTTYQAEISCKRDPATGKLIPKRKVPEQLEDFNPNESWSKDHTTKAKFISL